MDYLLYKGYKGSVEYSAADNCLCGKVLGLKNSLILYEGSTLDELKGDFAAGIESYLEDCKESSVQAEEPCGGILKAQLPAERRSRYRVAVPQRERELA
jgi:predicted HicB family RNase H-like nuclease